MASMERLLTLPEVAVVLGVCTKTARRMAAEGQIPTVRVGPKLLRVRAEALDAYLADRESAA